MTVEPETLLSIYEAMVRIAECDRTITKWLSAGKLQFQYYPVWGQEAIPAAFAPLLLRKDSMVTTYRGIHDVVAKGTPIVEIFAEIAGHEDGTSKGKGGPMHLSDPLSGLMVTTGIVGGGIPIANGLALAAQLRKTDNVTVVSFGDGAANIGAFGEALNMAATWKLPVIFLCQNNQYAEYSASAEGTASTSLASRAAGYEMPGVTVDGTDPIALHLVAHDAVERARRGDGPTLIEALCLRLQGHSFGSDETHMDQERLNAARQNPPLAKFRARLIADGVASEAILIKLEKSVAEEIAIAAKTVDSGRLTAAEELYTDIYAEPAVNPDLAIPSWRTAPAPQSLRHEGVAKTITMGQAITDALDIALAVDSTVFLLGEDIADPAGGVMKATKGLSTKYGRDRVRPTPIAEEAIVGAAIGAAMAGMRPVAEIMIEDFLAVAMDQIVNHAAKLRYMSGGRTAVPLTIRTMMAGSRGSFGAQHSQSLEAWFTHVPGLKVCLPSTPADAKGLLLSCIYDDDPCIIIEPVRNYFDRGPVPVGDYRVPLGVAAVARPGNDVTILSYSWMVQESLKAAEALAVEGIDAEVIDLRSLVPLDVATILRSVERTRHAVVAHSAVTFGGFGAELTSIIHEELHDTLRRPAVRVGARFTPVPFTRGLELAHFPNAARVADAVRKILKH